MKYHLPILFFCSIGILIFLCDCASYSSFQTARTVPKGQVAGTAGFGYNYLADESYLDAAIRMGVSEGLDVGLKFNTTTFGSNFTMIDFKHEYPTENFNFKRAIGFGISAITSDDQGFAVHLPAYFSFHSPNEWITTYVNPQVLYYVDLREQRDFNNSSIGAGTSVGLKLGKKFSLMPEWSFFVGKHDDEVKVNNLFSIGMGFNVK